MTSRKGLGALFLAGAIALGCAPGSTASATPLPAVFTLSGVFDDGGILSGQFGIDVYGYAEKTELNIISGAGSVLGLETYTSPPDSRAMDTSDTLTATALIFYNSALSPYRILRLQFSGPINQTVLPNSPPTTNLPLALVLTGSYECLSWLRTCPSPGSANTRYLTSASVQMEATTDLETPIPAALPLFAAGLGLIGVLARRRNEKAAV
jgi:hypothetical protein